MSQGERDIREDPVESGEHFPEFLRGLNGVVVAVVTKEGVLVDANDGFLGLLKGKNAAGDPGDVRSLFVNPRFDQLAARKERLQCGAVYKGILQLVDGGADVHSFAGQVYDRNHALLLVMERDIREMERLGKAVVRLNEALAERKREVLNLRRQLQRQVAESGRRRRMPERLGYTLGEAADGVTARVGGTRASRRMNALTPREREVLQKLVQGDTNKVVASSLNISERTVETHRANIMRKTRAKSLAELVRLCLQR